MLGDLPLVEAFPVGCKVNWSVWRREHRSSATDKKTVIVVNFELGLNSLNVNVHCDVLAV